MKREYFKVRVLETQPYVNYAKDYLGSIQRAYKDEDGDTYVEFVYNDDDREFYFFDESHFEIIESDPIVESVINQFKTRSEIGIKKYGTTLERNDLSTLDWLKHLQEEMMDAVLYIEKLKSEL